MVVSHLGSSFFSSVRLFLSFMCVCLLVCICAMCMQCSQQPEGISSPGIRVIGRCQLPDMSAVLNWNPLQEQEVL